MTTPAIEYPKGITIFGREPAVILGFIEAALYSAVTFGLGQYVGISQEALGPIIAVIAIGIGAYTAWATKDTSFSWVTGFIRAGVALLAVYGFTITDTQLAGLLTFVTLGVALFTRTQTTPVAFPAEPSPAQVVPVAPTPDVKQAVEEIAAEGTAAAEGVLSEEDYASAWDGYTETEVDALPGGGDAVPQRSSGF